MCSFSNQVLTKWGMSVLVALLIGLPGAAIGQEEIALDVAGSYEIVLPYAERGDPVAQYVLGAMLSKTRDRNRNVPEAVTWLEKSAGQGIARAQFLLAEIYFKGQDVPENYRDALKWYQSAARQELPEAQVALGTLYKSGQAVPKSLTQAAHWFGRAARQGQAVAQLNMGEFFAAGLAGLPQDKVEAYKWFVLAAGQGEGEAVNQREDLREQMTRQQILDAQSRAAALAEIGPRRSPRLDQQDESIRRKVAKLEAILIGAPLPESAAAY